MQGISHPAANGMFISTDTESLTAFMEKYLSTIHYSTPFLLHNRKKSPLSDGSRAPTRAQRQC